MSRFFSLAGYRVAVFSINVTLELQATCRQSDQLAGDLPAKDSYPICEDYSVEKLE